VGWDWGTLARVALSTIDREYPHHEAVLQTRPEPVRRPREVHPAFYGSYDWHSCVEMHWALVRLLRTAPASVPQAEIRAALDAHLTPAALRAEADFFAAAGNEHSERPYGWGWALRLAHELELLADSDGLRWAASLEPLAAVLEDRFCGWLPRATYPIRHGVHENSAFSLSLALPAARALAGRGRPRLLDAIALAAERWFGADRDYPGAWEPSGADFLSPALTEAELMSRLLPARDYPAWLGRFLPGIERGEPAALFTPAVVSDDTDGQIAHLHGLHLSRAWCWRRIGACLAPGDARLEPARAAADRHAQVALPFVAGSDYMVEHWLAAYAVLLLS
jgi:hypothetical protein